MKPIKSYKQKLGKAGEDFAVEFLQKKGFLILERNFRYGHKEIDVIGQKGNTVVFVEVKAGRSKNFGEPAERVDQRKQKQITEVALSYIQKNNLTENDFRFDVITVKPGGKKPVLEHLENAFFVPE
jgi:putative endonuclease